MIEDFGDFAAAIWWGLYKGGRYVLIAGLEYALFDTAKSALTHRPVDHPAPPKLTHVRCSELGWAWPS